MRRPTWQDIFNGLGCVIVLTILGLVVAGRTAVFDPTVQALLVIAGGLLGVSTLFRKNGKNGS